MRGDLMALRDDLKVWVPMYLWNTISRQEGYVVPAQEFNDQWNTNVAQGDHSAQAIVDILAMLYETVLHDTEGAAAIRVNAAGITATDVQAALAELRAALTADINALNTHKSSDDHDGRYYTEVEVNALFAALEGVGHTNQTVKGNADGIASNAIAITALDNALTTHKSSTDHDARYYTKAQIDAADANFVDKTTNQSIAGHKTFTGKVTIPQPVDALDPVTKYYVDVNMQSLVMGAVGDNTILDRHLSDAPTEIKQTAARLTGATFTGDIKAPHYLLSGDYITASIHEETDTVEVLLTNDVGQDKYWQFRPDGDFMPLNGSTWTADKFKFGLDDAIGYDSVNNDVKFIKNGVEVTALDSENFSTVTSGNTPTLDGENTFTFGRMLIKGSATYPSPYCKFQDKDGLDLAYIQAEADGDVVLGTFLGSRDLLFYDTAYRKIYHEGNRQSLGVPKYVTVGSTADPNTTLEPLILTMHANSPSPLPGVGGYWYIQTYFFSAITTTSNCTQIATSYNVEQLMFTRSRYNQVWGPWQLVGGEAVDAPSSQDLNMLLTEGRYVQSNFQNGPLGTTGYWQVTVKRYRGDDAINIQQKAVRFLVDHYEEWSRVKDSSGWSPWVRTSQDTSWLVRAIPNTAWNYDAGLEAELGYGWYHLVTDTTYTEGDVVEFEVGYLKTNRGSIKIAEDARMANTTYPSAVNTYGFMCKEQPSGTITMKYRYLK